MITIVTVWLCLITHVACDVVITVNNNGSDNDTCCVNGTCPCSSLSSALHNVSDNTVINITSESVTLHDIVGMGSGNLTKITITGNGTTIMCNNTGGVYCESCSDITIMGITWYQCGHTDPFRALGFIISSSKIFIQDCTFQNCPVYIQNAKGNISIKESNFIMDVFNFSCNYSKGLYISFDAKIVVAISSSRFNGDGCVVSALGCDCSGVTIKPRIDVCEINQFLFKNTNFSNYNHYGLDLRTSCEKAKIELLIINVYNNHNGITMDTVTDNSDSTVTSSSATFKNNVTVIVSSAAFINNSIALDVEVANTVNLSSATFINNTHSSFFGTIINFILLSCTFINTQGALSIHTANIFNLSSATFINNQDALNVYSADTINVSSTTFVNNQYVLSVNSANVVHISSATFINNTYSSRFPFVSTFSLSSATFINSSVTLINNQAIDMANTVKLSSATSIHSNVSCYNNSYTVIQMNPVNCTETNIVFTNVTFHMSGNYNGDTDIVYIETENTDLSIIFKNVNFMSNNATDTLSINTINSNQKEECGASISIQLTNCTFDENFASDHVVALNINADKNLMYYYRVIIEVHDCIFDDNIGGESIVYVNVPSLAVLGSVFLNNSTFSNNKGTALHLFIPDLTFGLGVNVLFINNSAINGAAVYIKEVDSVLFTDITNVQFINNSAELKGGAMYINLVVGFNRYCDVFDNISNTSNISFTNNSAGIAGNSIYFNIPNSCQIITNVSNESSLLYYLNMFKYGKAVFTKNPPVITSPYSIKLYPPAIAISNSDHDYFLQKSKMLGETIHIIASVLDYFNNITEPVTFFIDCNICGSEYILSTHLISVHNQSIYEINIFPTVAKDVASNTNISITFLSALSSIYRHINASLVIELSSCRAGYLFNNTQTQCVCYPHPDLVHCKGYYVEIKIGYWIGYLTQQHYTSSICPNNYCSSEHAETSPGYYSLHGKSDDQCSSHRTGVACGKCKSGYTLAYDSPDCINTEKCSAGMTILVIVLTILYWITIVAVVFGLMYFQFQISSGYAYGIIYYYSIVDILMVNDVSEEVFHLVSILSSFAKLTPQLFGQLCLVEGLSGIDQQFIHYSHALAVSLILLIIVLVTRYSPRLTQFVGRCIIRVICLLLLLSYTSLASTSLQLLRPLTFNDVDEVRTYSSPDIKYFTGRHLAYAIVAILCEVIIVIGLPLFLLLEPFLRQRVNLVRVKPLLDHFQGCYKDKYRWFAAYYLICRQVIILIVYVGNGNYYYMLYSLQAACVIIAMIHGCVQPYNNKLLNVLDEVILSILVLVVHLNLFSLSSFIPTNYFSVILLSFPLLLVCFIAIRKLVKYFFSKNKRKSQLYNPVETHEGDDEGR